MTSMMRVNGKNVTRLLERRPQFKKRCLQKRRRSVCDPTSELLKARICPDDAFQLWSSSEFVDLPFHLSTGPTRSWYFYPVAFIKPSLPTIVQLRYLDQFFLRFAEREVFFLAVYFRSGQDDRGKLTISSSCPKCFLLFSF
ncbi:hypothetical protein AVEN_54559-1 [Araneus ventricosus]|uniref:Uncharacterized protein n=1 Tax=Araneus ventricosus TaxID=182803 RepID=A0A4Y2BLF5_ARAVE|nr:hypothetical protein AVEN_54559-1 [Araneus ventricosus]